MQIADPVLAEYLRTHPEPVFDDGLDLPAERRREAREARAAPRLAAPATVEDLRIPGPPGAPEIPVRVYRPTDEPGLPVTVYYHGGGFVVGGLDTHDNAVRLLAEQARTVVVAVDYRLAPEHPYPAAVEDAVAAYRWALEHATDLAGEPEDVAVADGAAVAGEPRGGTAAGGQRGRAAVSGAPGRVAIAGDSAGGYLCALLGFAAPERGLPTPRFQLLIYPSTGAGPTASAREHADAEGGMSAGELSWYTRTFLGGFPPDRLPSYFRPALVPDLSGQPPTFVLTAGLDPLRDDGASYVRRLREAGVAAEWHDVPGMVHSFLRFMHAVPAARTAAQPAFDALRAALHG